jgi:predicted Zn-dependent protease
LNKKTVVAFLAGVVTASVIFMLIQQYKSSSSLDSVAKVTAAPAQSSLPTRAMPMPTMPVQMPTQAATTQSMPMGEAKAGSIDTLTEGLRARLEKEPNDVNGWVLLARSYHFLQRWDEAKTAFAKAKSLGYKGEEDQVPVNAAATENSTPDPVFESVARAAQQQAAQLQARAAAGSGK